MFISGLILDYKKKGRPKQLSTKTSHNIVIFIALSDKETDFIFKNILA